MSLRLTGDVLVEHGILTGVQLELCLRAQGEVGTRRRLGEIAIDFGFANRTDVEVAIAAAGGSANALGAVRLPYRLMKRLRVMPLGIRHETLSVAAADLLRPEEIEELMVAAATATNSLVRAVEIEPMDRRLVLQSINALMEVDSATVAAELARLGEDPADAGNLTQLINHILSDALQSRASDIHITNTERADLAWVAYRVDGELAYRYLVAPEAMAVIATRIKSMAGVDFTDTNMPHDGRLSTRYAGRVIDVRVSTLPVDIGEEIVIRLLDIEQVPPLSKLFRDHVEVDNAMRQMADIQGKSGGIILVTGPTGSGKSTTLNAILRAMDRSRIAIRTVEDPVELRVPLVGHVQVNEQAGLTYARALRSILRQDPDVIMVGELRDSETAEIALQAADTGHAVLTTLHTGSVVESVSRLSGMLSENYRAVGRLSLANTLRCVINQRLVQRLCVCAETAPTRQEHKDLMDTLGLPVGMPVAVPKGCNRCAGTGYFGRVIVPEMAVFPVTGEVRAAMERIMTTGTSIRQLMDIPGVLWYSQLDAVRNLLWRYVIDVRVASGALGRMMQGAGNG
jgi:type II secretory ATPase GspE/PulE/Tfp pilus assembly ATPase PilB-like protein